jgi:phosphate transport system substrate-binding protein
MATTRGRCTNFDYCGTADSRRDIEVAVGEDFVCPECGKPLKAPPVKAASSLLPVLIGGGVLVLVGGAVYFGMQLAGRKTALTTAMPVTAPTTVAAPAPATTAAAPATPAESILARLIGSPSVSGTVAPSIAAAYLTQIGDTDVQTTPGGQPGVVKVVGLRGDRHEVVLVQSGSSADGFKALGSGGAEIVMTSRRILPAERDGLAALGDMTTPAAEHVLAVDAAAVVVNPANVVSSLRKDQVRALLSGGFKDWGQLGAAPGPITVYAVDPATEDGANLASVALAGGPLAASIRKLPDGKQVAAAVAGDPHGVALVDLPSVGGARVVPLAETGSTPVTPTNHVAVASEDYPLSYRLYLYTAPRQDAGIAKRFVDFALSADGQRLAEQAGLVSATLKPAAAPAPATTTDKFRQFVAGAKRLAIDFRFNPNSSDLDLKGQRDIDRVTNYLLSNHFTGDHLILVGFADNQGDPATNVAVSKKRADALAAMFVARGLKPGKVAGFGGELPLADNGTEEGRQKNRRVEIYIVP